MPRNHEWQSRIKAVEREYTAMRQAADHFGRSALDDPSILRGDLRHREIIAASQNLEGTYIIRIFAEFETGSRQCWVTRWGTVPKTTDLIDGLAARCLIPSTHHDNCHKVRRCRNILVHEREEDAEELGVSDARAFLCTFFSFLPHQW